MAADRPSRSDTFYRFVGYGGIVGTVCVVTFPQIEALIRDGASAGSTLLTVPSVLVSAMLLLPIGFMLALPAAATTGLIYSFLPATWQRIWIAAIVGFVTQLCWGSGFNSHWVLVDYALPWQAPLQLWWRPTSTSERRSEPITAERLHAGDLMQRLAHCQALHPPQSPCQCSARSGRRSLS